MLGLAIKLPICALPNITLETITQRYIPFLLFSYFKSSTPNINPRTKSSSAKPIKRFISVKILTITGFAVSTSKLPKINESKLIIIIITKGHAISQSFHRLGNLFSPMVLIKSN